MRTMRGRAGWAAGAAATILVCLSVCGCGPKQQARTAQSADRPFTVTVNRTDNGAAAAPAAADSQAAAVPRALSFEMAGFAKAPAAGEPLEALSITIFGKTNPATSVWAKSSSYVHDVLGWHLRSETKV